MTAPILTDEQKAAFAEAAKRAIEADKTPALIRCELGEQFGLVQAQVRGVLKRANIPLFDTRTGLRGMRDVDRSVLDAVVERCKEMDAKGISPVRIRAELSIEFNIYETSISHICLKRGNIDIRSDLTVKTDVVEQKANEVREISLEKADYDASKDIVRKAAQKLIEKNKNVRFDSAQNQWWLEHRPVSRVQLIQSAGMGV